MDDAVPASIWLAIEDASLIGMANAWVCVCPGLRLDSRLVEGAVEAAVSMPITSAGALTSAPPKSPGWSAALVWMSAVRVSGCPLLRRRR